MTSFVFFPPKKPSNIVYHGCEQGHIKAKCPSKRIAEEYIAEVAKLVIEQGHTNQIAVRKVVVQPQGNVANTDNSNNDGQPAYSASFGDRAYCCKAVANC